VFYPQNIDQVAPFTIEASFPVLVNGVLFRTDSQVSIPPGSLFGEVLATAAEVGERGNISIGSSVSWQPVSGLANIAVSQSSPVVQRGTDPLDYSGAVNQLTGSLVNQALITTSDYEALLATRFPNQIFSAIPNLDKDKVTKKSGIIHLFGCNEDFSNLTELQKLEVANSFQGGWALVYVSDFNEVTLRVSVIATLIPGGTPGTVGTAINQALLEHFSLRNQRGKTSIKLNDAIAQVYKIDGVQSVSYLSFDLGDGVFKSENIALQNIYTLIVLGLVTVQFEGLPAVNSYVNI
jgi:hypothetical protein